MLGDKVGRMELWLGWCLVALPPRGMPVPAVAAVVTASSSTIVAAMAVASSSSCRHCVVLLLRGVVWLCVVLRVGGCGVVVCGVEGWCSL